MKYGVAFVINSPFAPIHVGFKLLDIENRWNLLKSSRILELKRLNLILTSCVILYMSGVEWQDGEVPPCLLQIRCHPLVIQDLSHASPHLTHHNEFHL